MIRTLSISNYALIDSLNIDFEKGFTALTGETGAGKSILLGAIALILGERADTKSLFYKDKKCVIEASFDTPLNSFNALFEELNVDPFEVSIVRREITPQGKSRIFINDSPVPLTTLKTFGTKLIDLHTQYQKFYLSNNERQLEFLDEFLDDKSILLAYINAFSNYMSICQKLAHKTSELNKISEEQDYYEFLNKELDEAVLQPDEDKIVEQELAVLDNSELLKEKLSSSSQMLSGDDMQEGITGMLYAVRNNISEIGSLIEKGEQLTERLNSCYIELKDILSEIDSINNRIVGDRFRADELRERLDFINKLLHKHKVEDVNALIDIHHEMTRNLQNTDDLHEQILSLEKEKKTSFEIVRSLAAKLSAQRKNNALLMSTQISEILKSLGIPNNHFVISLTSTDDYTNSGNDFVEFMFSANIGSEVLPLANVASGGELSRVMLALKSVIAMKNAIPTVIFDEIDSGISGATAAAVAMKLEEISHNIQVIAITHLPQIAAKANNQYLVFKEISNDRTYTKVNKLDYNGRVKAIAAMISGEHTGPEALKNAKVLLGKA